MELGVGTEGGGEIGGGWISTLKAPALDGARCPSWRGLIGMAG